MKTTFSTSIIGIASFLVYRGQKPSHVKRPNGRIDWVFSATDELYRLLDLYNRDVSVPVSSFAATMTKVRGEMLAARDQRGDEK